MGSRYYPVEITVPASTPPGNPTKVAVPLEDAILADVEVIIPAGHVALTGVRVLASNQQVIPWGNLSWIKGNDYVRVFEYDFEIGAASMSVNAYNVDVIAHTFYLRFHVRDLVDANAGTPSSVVGGIGGVVTGGTGGTGVPVTPPITAPPPIITPPPPIIVPPLGPPGTTTTVTTSGKQQQYFTMV